MSNSVRNAQVISPKLGYLKVVSINGILTAIESADWKFSGNPKYTNYAYTPMYGPKQKTLHSRGTAEITISMSGEVSMEAAPLFNWLLNPYSRGYYHTVIIQQDTPGLRFLKTIFEEVSISGNPNSTVKFSITGRSLYEPDFTNIQQSGRQHPIPTWTSGSNLVESWTVSHRVALTPKWWNDQSLYPKYYRPGESDFTFTLNSVRSLQVNSRISLGFGQIALVNGVVTGTSSKTGGRTDPMTYSVSLTNTSTNKNSYTPGVTVAASYPGNNYQSPVLQSSFIVTPQTSINSSSFKLTVKGQTTDFIPLSATAEEVKTNIENLPSVGQGMVEVTGPDSGPWEVKILTTPTDSVSNPEATLSIQSNDTNLPVQDGVKFDQNQIYSVTFLRNPTGGTFILSINGVKSDPIPYDVNTTLLESYIGNIYGVGPDNVKVLGDLGDWKVYLYGSFMDSGIQSVYGDGSSLTGTDSPDVVFEKLDTTTVLSKSILGWPTSI
jgi:hypothetical protein